MGVQRKFRNTAYGHKNPLQYLTPPPIIAVQDPTGSDQAELGTMWVNSATNAYFVLTSNSAGTNIWTAQSAGSTTVASLEVTGGSGDVLVVDAGGDTRLGGDLTVSGNTDMTGSLTVTGNFVANGDFDITDAASISLTSTNNAPQAIYLHANGGTSETVEIRSDQGTGAQSVYLLSDVGGVTVEAAGSTSNTAVHLVADSGGFQLDSALTSQINVTGASQNLQLNATGGSIAMTATQSTAGAITVSASGASGTLVLQGVGGATLEATNNTVAITSGTGAINVGTDSAAHTVTVGNNTGATSVVLKGGTAAGGSILIGTTANDVPVTIGSSTGASAILINAGTGGVGVGTNAIAHTVTIGNVTGASAVNINTGTAGSTYTTTNGALGFVTGTGAITVGTDAVQKSITIGNATGNTAVSVNVGTGNLNLGTSATAHATVVGSTTAGSTLALQTPTGTKVVAANGVSITTAGVGVSLPGGLLVLAGAGAPSAITAPAGSLYLRSDPAGATSRLYVNTDSSTTWTNVTCAG